jgi:hypothetical protein
MASRRTPSTPVSPRRAIEATTEERPDDADPGEQISGETLDCEILPPAGDETEAVEKAAATPYAPAVITAQYKRAICGTLEILRFGAMLIEVDTVLTRENSRTARHSCKGDQPSLMSWLEENCPEVNYKTAMRFKMLTQDMQKYCQIPAKLPVSLALPGPDGAVHLDDLPPNVNVARVGKIQQQVWDMIQGKSARQLMFQFRTDAAPRGGDHGGGAAYSEQQQQRRANPTPLAIEEWQHLVTQFRDWVLGRKTHVHVPPAILKTGLQALNDAIKAVEDIIQKG